MAPINDFLSIVHKHTPSTSVIGLTTITGTQTHTQWYRKDHIHKLLEAALAVDKRANVYVRITPLAKPPDRGRGLEQHSLGASCLWVDLDAYGNVFEAVAKLQAMDKPPSMIVNSGNGLHAYWQLAEFTTDLDGVKARNLGLIVALNDGQKDGIADSCYDLARILRLPGTYNIKNPEQPKQCTIIDYKPERVYKLTDFTPAEYTDNAMLVWDSIPLPGDFLESIRERDKKLVNRITTIENARKVDGIPLKPNGDIDRSRNDAYIATRLLGLGFGPETILSVLMQPDWLSGAKYTQTGRYDYVVMTVNAALRVFNASEDRYFIKSTFQTDRLAHELNTQNRFIYVAEKLWRYDNGVFLEDGEQYIKAQCVQRLGKRWSSRASDETVRYVIDQAHIPQESVNQITEYANCINGMLHIPTLELKPHSPAYLSLSQVPVQWVPSASTQAIDAFIAQILPPDAINVFWEFFGSAFITARYFPKHFLVLCGPGDSGKSKVIELMGRFFGKRNVRSIPFQTLADNKFAVASLFGKMVNLFSDLSQAEANNGDFIKTLTGDDPISGERKFKDWFEFKPTTKLAFSANHFPKVKSPDEYYFRRAVIIPCNNLFTRATADPGIVDKLATPDNFSGMLVRLVQGYQRLVENNGLTEAESVTKAGAEYRFSADTVAGFWQACQFNPKASTTKQDAYAIYRQMCEAGNRRAVSDDLFFKRTADMLDRLGMTASYDQLVSPSRNVEGVRLWRYHGRQMPDHASFTIAFNPTVNGRQTN